MKEFFIGIAVAYIFCLTIVLVFLVLPLTDATYDIDIDSGWEGAGDVGARMWSRWEISFALVSALRKQFLVSPPPPASIAAIAVIEGAAPYSNSNCLSVCPMLLHILAYAYRLSTHSSKHIVK